MLKQVFSSEIVDLILHSIGRDELVEQINECLTNLRENLMANKADIAQFEISKVEELHHFCSFVFFCFLFFIFFYNCILVFRFLFYVFILQSFSS